MTNIRVRGAATSEEIAAVLAVVAAAERPVRRTGYQTWRATRLAALRGHRPDAGGARIDR